ncbi:hypothetical protein OPAG_00203 [Rhodococcus opacus PD630]|uniref:hypothetical protein n=1 Tax=Rhodococcus opacus TaxID=37919 RepID=UPI00029CB67A|nr:hypothetical protein [Rhodococcus opacus]AHK33000.1 hypothetical protein Pd630_LPD05809 [Rhodococcus opacus PD630]EHI41046.1 hypothetical protein OPAG_00203 [Rhodococcus opacus PD630]UDG95322.1 hypothetical protein K2Z90_005452 [Rhodococcus opacus PD630]
MDGGQATHIERHGEPRLVCELYSGVLVVDGGRVQTMLSFGDEVEPLPDDLREAFTIPGRQAQTAADRFGDLVDFAALSRYFDGPHRIRTALPPGAWARPAWTARAVAGLPMLEVRATHFTTIPGSRTLVCELYPGILVVAKYGVCTVLTYGNAVELLPPRSDERLAMTSGQAVLAAVQLGRQMSSQTRKWPPPQWVRGRDLRNR